MIRFGQVYKCLIIFLFVGICLSGGYYAFSADQQRESIIVNQFSAVTLVYHRFGDNRYPSANTSVQDFEAHIRYLKNHGFVFSTASQVYENCEQFLDQKQVVITIDDGYHSFYLNGLTVLKRNNVKATLFINTESVGWKDYLTWEQIKEISNQGIEIGHHSHAHSYFMNLSDSERVQKFKDDLLKADYLFQKHLGYVPKVYSYPYGEFDQLMLNVLKKHGYKIAFAQNSGVWSEKSNQLAIPRFPIAGAFVKLEQFKSKVNMKPLNWQQSDQLPLIVKGGEEVSFKMMLDDPGLSQLNCFIAGQSRTDAFTEYDGTVQVLFKAPANRRRTLITFTARHKKGEWHWGSRMLIDPDVKE